jgi:hypothetical protein
MVIVNWSLELWVALDEDMENSWSIEVSAFRWCIDYIGFSSRLAPLGKSTEVRLYLILYRSDHLSLMDWFVIELEYILQSCYCAGKSKTLYPPIVRSWAVAGSSTPSFYPFIRNVDHE